MSLIQILVYTFLWVCIYLIFYSPEKKNLYTTSFSFASVLGEAVKVILVNGTIPKVLAEIFQYFLFMTRL